MPRKSAAKKPKALANFVTRKRSSAKPKKNALSFASQSAIGKELTSQILPGVGGYAVARLVGRIVRTIISKKFPALAKHGAVGGNILGLLAAWYGAGKIKQLRSAQTAITVGSGIAVIQSIIQVYLPGLAWIFDAQETAAAPAATPQGMGAVNRYQAARQRGTRYVSPGELETERSEEALRRGEPITYSAPRSEPPPEVPTAASVTDDEQLPDDLLGDDEEVSDLYGGVFAQ
jgi:hypothetical protein